MFRLGKFPFVIALIIASGVADEKHYIPFMYGQCEIDEYLKYNIRNTDSNEYNIIVSSNRTVLDNFDHENFVMRPIGSGANFYFKFGETNSFKPMKLTEECQRYGICKEVDNYPKANISILVEEYRRLHNLEITHFEVEDDVDRLNIINEFCAVETLAIEPQAAQDENDDWYYIVNTNKHKQMIRTNVCKNLRPATELLVSRRWKKECVQKHYYRSFKAISWTGEVINKMFRVPSYCSCVITEKK